MKKISLICSCCLFIFAISGFSQPGDGSSLTQPHPDYDLINLRPEGFDVRVNGMDYFSDGRLAIATWNNFKFNSDVYIVEGGALESGDPADVSSLVIKKYAENMREIGGLHIVNDSVYVLQKHQLTLLIDANGNELFDDNAQERMPLSDCDEKWGVWNSSVDDPNCPGAYVAGAQDKNLEFAISLAYNHQTDKFFVGLPTAWGPEREAAPERGCVIEVDRQEGTWEAWSCGMRTPNALAFGPENTLWMGDNQGHYNPCSPFTHLQKGHHYGMIKTSYNGGHTYPPGFSEDEVTPPSLWLAPDRILSISPSNPVFIKEGIFKGQFIIGDDNLGTLQRVFLEKVWGEYQGAHFHFCGGLDAGTQKLILDEDGAIIVGGLGVGGDVWGGWQWQSTHFGLQKLTRKANITTPKFEMLAIRTTGAQTFEIEFTAPVGDNATDESNYEVRTFHYEPTEGYGGQPVQNIAVSVSSVTKVSDTKVELTLSDFNPNLLREGKSQPQVVHFRAPGVVSATGDPLWATEAYYTMLSPGPAEVNGCMDIMYSEYNPLASYDDGLQCENLNSSIGDAGVLSGLDVQIDQSGRSVSVTVTGDYSLTVANVKGETLWRKEATGPGQHSLAVKKSGIYFLTLLKGENSFSRRFVVLER
jgi:hypothetical protein